MSDLVDAIKSTPEFISEYEQALKKNNSLPLVQKAQVCDVITGKLLAWEQAGKIMANEIYNLTEENDNLQLENDGLKFQLGNKLNKEDLQNYCKDKKLKFGIDETRNKRILDRLQKTLKESRIQIDNSKRAAQELLIPMNQLPPMNKK